MLGHLDGRLDLHVAIQIARVTATQSFDALPLDAKGLAVLRAIGNINPHLACQRRNLDLAAQRRCGHRDGNLAMKIVAFTFKYLVLLNANLNVQIARRATIGAGLAVACGANPHAVINARRHFDF